MMFKKKTLAAAFVAGFAFAGTASAVTVNQNGLGDLLIAPSYMIGGGWKTDIKVINTSLTQSVVAKVVVHHQTNSSELLDFLIYLSPSDVFNGTFECLIAAANGECTEARMYSEDDSVQQLNSAAFATSSDPAVYPRSVANNGSSLTNLGYITVIESKAYNVAPNAPGVSKSNILAAFNADMANPLATETPNVLTGVTTLRHPAGSAMSLPMVAMADYNNIVKQIIGQDTALGFPNSQATTSDVEDALWSDGYVIPYKNLSLLSFTFPTKMTYRNVARPGQYTFASTVCYGAQIFDNSENTIVGQTVNVSPLPTVVPQCVPEHSWLTIGQASKSLPGFQNLNTNQFTSGWALINYTNSSVSVGQTTAPSVNLGGSGAPGIVTYINSEGTTLTWNYAPSN